MIIVRKWILMNMMTVITMVFEFECLHILGFVLNAFCALSPLFESLQSLIWWLMSLLTYLKNIHWVSVYLTLLRVGDLEVKKIYKFLSSIKHMVLVKLPLSIQEFKFYYLYLIRLLKLLKFGLSKVADRVWVSIFSFHTC